MVHKPRGIDEIIERAMQEGTFDNLQGRGKPLKLDENPYLDPEWQLAYHLLQENGFAPAFVEKRQAIEVALAEARQHLVRTWQWSQQNRAPGNSSAVDMELEHAKSQFEDKISEINAAIRDYNLEIPVPLLFKALISSSDELLRLLV